MSVATRIIHTILPTTVAGSYPQPRCCSQQLLGVGRDRKFLRIPYHYLQTPNLRYNQIFRGTHAE
jgi:hypothetical protein